MKCKVIRAYSTYRVGDVIEPTGVFRQHLQARGLIEPIVEPEAGPVVRAESAIESAVAVPPENAALPAPSRSRRRFGK